MRMTRSTTFLAATAALAAFAFGSLNAPIPVASVIRGGDAAIPGGLPFLGAILEPSIAAAELDLGWHIPRPNDCAGSDASIPQVYVNVANRQADIVYRNVSPLVTISPCVGMSGNLELYATPALPPLPDTSSPTLAQSLALEAASQGAVATVILTTDGLPIIAIQGNFGGDCTSPATQEICTSPQQNPAAVKMQYGLVDMELYGQPDWTTAEMVAIASSVR